MAFFSGHTPSQLLYLNYHSINLISPQSAKPAYPYPIYSVPTVTVGKRWLSASAESTPSEFQGPNAYQLLGVSETSSFAEIKASFHKLAKETHPDVAKCDSISSAASKQFIQILAAYEILSDSGKRTLYDRYLLSQRTLIQRHSRQGYVLYAYESHGAPVRMEVVEWLKWYRSAITEILSEKRVVIGSGYFDVLERDFYSAMHKAYYGPEIESLDHLPEHFEAEERSQHGTSEVLHLVSGRQLFGMVRVVNKTPELSESYKEKLTSCASDLCHSFCNADNKKKTDVTCDVSCEKQNAESAHNASDAYKDLELHVEGRLVAMATRSPGKRYINQIHNVDSQDCINVFLMSHEDQTDVSQGLWKDAHEDFPVGSRFPLGTITGLRSSSEEGSCCVCDNHGVNTHLIMKHRTLMVKHMNWYRIGDKVSVCECRCTRARLPPSKFWLFEPRCGTHDIGGWYVETFGRNKKGQTVPSQRYWDGLDTNHQFDKRLHPAMYLLTLAYRTLDIEDARQKRKALKDIIEAKMFRLLSWCKRFV